MGWPRPDFAPNVDFGPQVACVTADSARIVWRTIAHVRGDVEVRVPGGAWRVVRGRVAAGREHDVALDRLAPGAAVEYRVLHDGAPTSPVYTFRTAGEGAFTFAVIGDTGSGGKGQIDVRDQLASIDPVFVLHVGDIAYEHGRRVEVVRRHFTPFRDLLATRPWYIAWGNHDVKIANGAHIRELFRFPESTPEGRNRYYAFDWGDLRVWALDLSMEWGKGSAQFAWLKRDLEASRSKWKVVYSHYPPYSSSPYARGFTGIWKQLRAELCPLLEANGVDLYCSGHTHGYERSKPIRGGKGVGPGEGTLEGTPEGTLYVVCGGGGKRLNEAGSNWWTAMSSKTLQCMAIDVSSDGLRARAIDQRGREIDSFTILPKRR